MARAALQMLACAALLLVSLPANAESLEGSITSTGPLVWHGQSSVELRPTSLEATSGSFSVTDARLVVYNQPRAVVALPDPSPLGPTQLPLNADKQRDVEVDGTFAAAAADDGWIRVFPAEEWVVQWSASDGGIVLPDGPASPMPEQEVVRFEGAVYEDWQPRGTFAVDGSRLSQVSGEYVAIVFGLTLATPDGDIETGCHPRAGTPPPPPGTTAPLQDCIFVLLFASNGFWSLDGEVRGRTSELDLDLPTVGDLEFHGVEGTPELDGAPFDATTALLTARGTFAVHGAFTDEGATWAVTGDAVRVRLGGTDWWTSSGATAAAAATGLVALAVLIKFAIAAIAARDDGETRAQVLTVIQQDPGITLREVAQRTGLHRSTVSYHLYRLRRRGEVRSDRKSNRQHFRASGAAVPERRPPEARHPIRGALYAILSDGPMTTQQILDRWVLEGRAELTPSLISYHLSLLVKAEVVVRTRIGRAVKWSLVGLPAGTAVAPGIPATASALGARQEAVHG